MGEKWKRRGFQKEGIINNDPNENHKVVQEPLNATLKQRKIYTLSSSVLNVFHSLIIL